ncbi:DUF998 domain-containing protein [Brachybacterium sp.]|uniref:DUF998 domain-containing protein n=1 Tax=Brachybacterium sp. TaxID=1891286 RepID=UPI002ED05437
MTALNPVNLLLWTGVAGAAGSLAVVLIEGWSRPGYSAVQHPVSALALGPRGGIQRANFALAGAAITAGGLGVIGLETVPMVALGLVVVVLGLALALSAVPMDPSRGYPSGAPSGDPDPPSRSHRIHDLAGAGVFFSLPIIAIVAVFVLPEWWMRLGSAAMAAWLFVALGLFSRAWEAHSPRAGLAQRAFIVPGWLWLASLFCVLAIG